MKFSGPVVLRLLVVTWLACCLPGIAVAGEKITNDKLGFDLILLDGFVEAPEILETQPNILHGFRLGDPEDDEPDVYVVIEKLLGTLPRTRMRKEDLPDFNGHLIRPKWQGYDVNGVAIVEEVEGWTLITYNVQIPLKRGAIQVKLIGPKEREAELSQLLDQVLANLTGESNWQGLAETSSDFGRSSRSTSNSGFDDYGKVLLGIAIGLYLVGVVGLWLVSRTGQRGLVLGVGCVLFLIGVSIAKQGGRTRELAMFGGTCSLLGLTGGILGIVDLARKPKKKKGPPEARSAAGIRMEHDIFDAEVLPSAAVDAEVIDDPPRS